MSKIELINESCINQKVDAIVNAANGDMKHDGGVAWAILQKAGQELNVACHEYKLPIKDGEVIVTPAFNIKNAKVIIHAVGPNFWITPKAYKELFNAYFNSLIALKNNNYHSISFPLISSSIFAGKLKNPVGESTKQCIRAYKKFSEDYPNYEINVKLCAYGDNEYNQAKKEFEQRMSNNSPFKNIDEVINYLKNDYKKMEYTPPSKKIEKSKEVIILGGPIYDMRIFDVWEFLDKNNYIFDEYYDRDKYPEFWKEDYTKYDYDNLDIKRVSYMIFGIFNAERISEGLIDDMVLDGTMLRLVERANAIKVENKNNL